MERFRFRIDDLKSVRRKIFLLACLVLVAHCLAMISKYVYGRDFVFGIVPMFDFYEEHNIPTYFSALNLLFTAAILYSISQLVARSSSKLAVPWRVLSAGFIFMSIDEFCDVRMIISRISQSLMGSESLTSLPFFSVAWTVPVTAIVVLLAVYFFPFLLRLKRVYLLHFGLAGLLFVLATLGLETVEGLHMSATSGVRDVRFMLYVTLEEAIEIFSIIYFQFFLIAYMDENFTNRQSTVRRAA